MNRYVSTLCLLVACTSCAPRPNSSDPGSVQSISIIDRNGMSETVSNNERLKQYQNVDFLAPQPFQKVLKIYRRDKSGSIKAKIYSYHPNGQPKQYLEATNSRALGIYREWYPNGCLKLEACVIGGEADINPAAENTWLFDGIARVWEEDGSLSAEISYFKGELDGDSIYYHPNGALWRKIPYQKDKIHGEAQIYLETGQLMQTTCYQHDFKHGDSRRFWDDCRYAFEESYDRGILTGGKYYDIRGTVIAEIKEGFGYRVVFGKQDVAEMHEYRNGVPEGEVRIFGSDHKLLRKYHVKNGQKHGEEIEFHEMPHLRHIPKLSLTWYQGKVQGIAKTWYDNGVQESKREMSNNVKNGLLTAWYRDGSIMLIEEYRQDKLVKGEYFRRGERHPISTVKEGSGTATLFDAEGNFTCKVSYEEGAPTEAS